MLELKKIKDVTAYKFFTKIGRSLEQEADIRTSRPEISIICRDIDEIITNHIVQRDVRYDSSSHCTQQEVPGIQKSPQRKTQMKLIQINLTYCQMAQDVNVIIICEPY